MHHDAENVNVLTNTSTGRDSALAVPAANGPRLVQVTVCPLTKKLHPVPEPDAKLIPAGSVSLTVIIFVAGPFPTLVTVSVQTPLPRGVGLPA